MPGQGAWGHNAASFTTAHTAMKVIVIYGSPNDKPFMEPAREYFAQENVPYEETVLSAHRDLPELIRFLGDLEASRRKSGYPGCGGLSAAFPAWW